MIRRTIFCPLQCAVFYPIYPMWHPLTSPHGKGVLLKSPVQRDFGDLAFTQGEELVPHIDALRRILPGDYWGYASMEFYFLFKLLIQTHLRCFLFG